MRPLNLNLNAMLSTVLPPSIFYTVLLPNAKTEKERFELMTIVLDHRSTMNRLFVKFKYGKGEFRNAKYYAIIQAELLQMDQYLKDLGVE